MIFFLCIRGLSGLQTIPVQSVMNACTSFSSDMTDACASLAAVGLCDRGQVLGLWLCLGVQSEESDPTCCSFLKGASGRAGGGTQPQQAYIFDGDECWAAVLNSAQLQQPGCNFKNFCTTP